MISANRTSKRLLECFATEDGGIAIPSIPEAQAIAKKYQRLEEALEDLLEPMPHLLNKVKGESARLDIAERIENAFEALSFDPLAS